MYLNAIWAFFTFLEWQAQSINYVLTVEEWEIISYFILVAQNGKNLESLKFPTEVLEQLKL